MILTRRRPPPTHVSRNYFDERRQKEYFLKCTNGHKYLFVAAWVGGSVSCFVRPGPTRPLSPVSAGPGNASNVGTGWGLSEGCVLLKRDLRRYKHFTTIVTCGPLAVPCITLSRQIATPGTLLLIKKSLLFSNYSQHWPQHEHGNGVELSVVEPAAVVVRQGSLAQPSRPV